MAVTGNVSAGVLIADAGTTATFTNGTYSSNLQSGVVLQGATGAVTVGGSTLNSNGPSGLDLSNVGAVTLTDLTLSGNAGLGGTITNASSLAYTTSSGGAADTVELTSTQLERTVPAQQPISYTTVPTLTVSTGSGKDTILTRSENAATATTLAGGAGIDDYRFDNTASPAIGGVAILEVGGCVGGDMLDFTALSPGITLDLGATANQVLNANLLVQLSAADAVENVTGTALDDTITGNGCPNALSGVAGIDGMNGAGAADTITGGTGNEVALTGSTGDDLFVWKPGDGNDVLDGDADVDTLRVDGSGAAEAFTVGPNGPRVVLTRNVGAISLDAGTIEAVELNASSGADSLAVVPLPTTSVAFEGAADADSLSFDGLCAAVLEAPGSVTAAGAQPVTHSNVETVSIASAIQFAQTSYSRNEDQGPAPIEVVRVAGNGTAGVQFATSDGTADASDYTAVDAPVGFTGGQSSQILPVPLTADATIEGDETVNLTLSAASAGAHLCVPDAAVLTIENDDAVDLRTTITDAPEPVRLGSKLTHKVVVRNLGTVADPDVEMAYHLPAKSLLVSTASSSPGDGCSLAGTTVTCTHGTLAGKTQVSFTIVVIPAATGTATATASASGGMADANQANDADSTSTSVTLPACSITGTTGPDILDGTGSADVICGRGGSDDIDGKGGNDVLIGAGRGDALTGGPGFDVLLGGKGVDTLDSRDGVAGNDALNGGPRTDVCRGDSGDLRIACP